MLIDESEAVSETDHAAIMQRVADEGIAPTFVA